MSALLKTCLAPSRPMPTASIRTSLVSLPLAPAFIRHALVERSRARADDIAGSGRLAERPRRQADHHARHAAVAHDQVGADADDIDRQSLRKQLQEVRKIV